jgi:hypothetical protein
LYLGAASPSAQRIASFPVSGQVVDETGGVLPQATVQLLTVDGTARQSTAADAAGGFRFDAVAPARYELRIACEGFRPATIRVTVSNRLGSEWRWHNQGCDHAQNGEGENTDQGAD